MFKKLGQKYKGFSVPAGRDQDTMQAIFDFAKKIEPDAPQLFKILKAYDSEEPIDWYNVDEAELKAHYDYFMKAIRAVAPEGTEFKENGDGTLAFIGFDNVLDPNQMEGEPSEFTYDMSGATMMQEKHIKYVMKEAAKRIVKSLNKE